jgi:hypothetical protein
MLISNKKRRGIFFLLAMFLMMIAPAQAGEMVNKPMVKLRSLDKVTARTEIFEANVGSTVKFGSLFIKVQACRKAPPIEQPESAAFLQVWEVDAQEEAQWVFSGWMFASSPGLSSMDHPIYDVWVLDCLEQKTPPKVESEADEAVREEGELSEDKAPVQPEIEGEAAALD